MNFASVYDRPTTLKKGLAQGQTIPLANLRQARQGRRKMVSNLIQKAGGYADFQKQAYGPGYNPGDLRAALRTVRQGQSQVASGTQSPDLLNTQLYQNAIATRNRLLSKRRQELQKLSARTA